MIYNTPYGVIGIQCVKYVGQEDISGPTVLSLIDEPRASPHGESPQPDLLTGIRSMGMSPNIYIYIYIICYYILYYIYYQTGLGSMRLSPT